VLFLFWNVRGGVIFHLVLNRTAKANLQAKKGTAGRQSLGMGYTLIHSYTLKSKSAYVGKGHNVVSVIVSSSSADALTAAIEVNTSSL